jgi:hypothetical protein
MARSFASRLLKNYRSKLVAPIPEIRGILDLKGAGYIFDPARAGENVSGPF